MILVEKSLTLSSDCKKKPSNYKNLSGQKFTKLLVLEDSGERRTGRYEVFWLCVCDCGRYCKVLTSNLTGGKSKTCGTCSRKSPTCKGGHDLTVFGSRASNGQCKQCQKDWTLTDIGREKIRIRNKSRVHKKNLWKIRNRIAKKRALILEIERLLSQ